MANTWLPPESRGGERTRAAFFELSHRLSAARTPEEAARIIVGVAQELLGLDACCMDLYSPEADLVQDVLTMDSFGGPPVDVPPAYNSCPPTPIIRRVIQEGALLILRPENPGPMDGWVPFGNTARLSRSLMFVPLRHGDRVTGVLSIQSYAPDA